MENCCYFLYLSYVATTVFLSNNHPVLPSITICRYNNFLWWWDSGCVRGWLTAVSPRLLCLDFKVPLLIVHTEQIFNLYKKGNSRLYAGSLSLHCKTQLPCGHNWEDVFFTAIFPIVLLDICILTPPLPYVSYTKQN